MDSSSGIIPVMPMNSNDAFGGNTFMYLFGLLILLGMFNGGFGGFGGWGANGFANAIGYENLATSNEVQRGFDNQNSLANQREILTAVNNGTAQSVAATNQTFHDTLGIIQNRYDELARDISGIAVTQANAMANQNECCCATKQMILQTSANTDAQIAQNRYESAMNTAAINANTTAQTQKILDAISQNKIDELQSQVNQLQLQNATANVLRYPNAWTFNGGFFPPLYPQMCNCGNV